MAGYAVSGQLLRLWEPPDVTGEPVDVLRELAEHLGRWCMGDEKVWRRLVDRDDPGSNGGNIIMAYRGVIADVDGRFDACISDTNVACGGCSGGEALAVFLALFECTGMDPASAMRAGLGYAARIDIHVGPPYSVVGVAASGLVEEEPPRCLA
jgi:ATP-dependent protease HslVU (ClpYQ) peptidase subunit